MKPVRVISDDTEQKRNINVVYKSFVSSSEGCTPNGMNSMKKTVIIHDNDDIEQLTPIGKQLDNQMIMVQYFNDTEKQSKREDHEDKRKTIVLKQATQQHSKNNREQPDPTMSKLLEPILTARQSLSNFNSIKASPRNQHNLGIALMRETTTYESERSSVFNEQSQSQNQIVVANKDLEKTVSK